MRKLFACRLTRWLPLLLLFAHPAQAQAPTWTWVTNPPISGGSVFNTVMTTDAAGDVYVAGSFTGSFTLGFFTLTAAPAATSEVFVAKFTSTGTPVWAQQGSGATANKHCAAIAVNAAGEVLITGSFAAPSAVFGTTVLNSRGTTDTFVAKLYPSGLWRWAVGCGGAAVDRGYAVALAGGGEAYVAGDFESPVATFGTTVLPNGTSGGNASGFVAKLSTSGLWIWARSSTGSAGADLRIRALTPDGAGNLYVGGAFRGAVAFGAAALAPPGSGATALFIARLSTAGVWQRAATTGGPGTSSITALAADASGGVYATGYFGGPGGVATTFGATSLVTAGGLFNAFVARLDPAGAWQWATPAGGAGFDYGTALAVDVGGTVLVKGTFQSRTATLGTINLSNSHGAMGGADSFLATLTGAGTWRRAFGFAGSSVNDGGLGLSSNGVVAITGSFTDPPVPLGFAVLTNTGANGQGVYFAQLDLGPLAVASAQPETAVSVWPTPTHETLWIANAPGTTATLLDALGRPALAVPLTAGAATLDVRALPAGVYLLWFTDAAGRRGVRRVIRD